jgi:uncharacterized protein GlcG (DUF336 family)
LGLAEARAAVSAVLAALGPDDKPPAVAVVDAHGSLVMLARADGAPPRMGGRARAKAHTAAALGVPTATFRGELHARGATLDEWGDPQLTSLEGGLPVALGEAIVGAVGCSGNPRWRDQELTLAALEAIARMEG